MNADSTAVRGARPPTAGSTRPLAMEIDLDAVSHNMSLIRARAARDRTLIAVLKADAYGHGAVEIARTVSACGADLLATGSLDEAVAIRAAGVRTPTVLFGCSLPDAAVEVARAGFIPSIDSAEAIKVLSGTSVVDTPVFIKVDCGFGRLGIPLDQARDFVSWAASQPRLKVQGIHVHPTFSDSSGREWAKARVREFETLIDELASDGVHVPVTQALTSPGVLTDLTDRLTAIAVGTLLFGLSPVSLDFAEKFQTYGLRPALHAIRTKLIHVGRCRKGDGAAPYLRHGAAMTGIMPLGLRLGYRPPVGDRAFAVLVRGRRVPVLRVCLDNSVLDLTGAEDATVGDEVVALGVQGKERISLEEIAEGQSSSPLAVVTGLGALVPHRYIRLGPQASPPVSRNSNQERPGAR